MLRTCIDTETSTKEYPPYTKAIYNYGGIYGKNGNLRNLHQRALTAGIGQGSMSMVTGATSMSNNSAAAALAAAEEFRRAFNSHPLHTNPPSHHHSTTHSPLHQLPEDIPGLPRHRPNNSADFSPRLSETGLFYSGCKVHGTSICLSTNGDLDGVDGGLGSPPPPLPPGRGGGQLDNMDTLDLDMAEDDIDVDESDVPNETTAFNPTGGSTTTSALQATVTTTTTTNNNNPLVSSSNATIVSNGSNHRLLDSSSTVKSGVRSRLVGNGFSGSSSRINGVSNPHHLIRPFNSTQSSSRGPPGGLAGHSDGEDDDVDDGDEDDENSILRSGKQPDPPPYDHSNCSNSLHKSCACVSFIAEHTKAREEATKIKEDWKYVAMVLDRLFLWIFTLAVCVGTAGIILQAPSLYDERKPIDREISDIGLGPELQTKNKQSSGGNRFDKCSRDES